MAVVPTILPGLDAIRAIGGMLGLRPFTVKIRIRTWQGFRPDGTRAVGFGPYNDIVTTLVSQGADGSQQPVMVRQVSRKEAIASNGLYTDRDLKVGPITPPYPAGFGAAAGGFNDTTVDPVPTASPTEIAWLIFHEHGGTFGIPKGGACADKIGEEATALHTYVILRANGRKP